MAVPDSIKQHKPTQFGAVEIRCIGGHYYVYKVTSQWSAEKGRPQKITGKSIGKITEKDGFIPNLNGINLMKEQQLTPDIAPKVKKYGAYEMLRQLSPEMEETLKKHFSDLFQEICTVALLRLVDNVSSAEMIQPTFLDSYLSNLYGDLSLSESSARKFITKLGSMQNHIDAFMRDSIGPGTTILFDGTSILTGSEGSPAVWEYNQNHSLDPPARILYIFEKDSHRPVFYRILRESIADRNDFIDTIKESGCTDCVIIADNGFYSKENVSALLEAGMRYIIPLQDDTVNIEPQFYPDPDENKLESHFTYKNQLIWCCKQPSGNKGNCIYTFRDNVSRDKHQENSMERPEKDHDEEEPTPMDTRTVYYSLCSNLDITPEELYLEYRQRWDIEEGFSYFKNDISSSASYEQSDDYFRGWTFLNYISFLYYCSLLNTLKDKGLDEKYTPEDAITMTKNIYRVDIGDGNGYRISEIQKQTEDLLDGLSVDL